MSVEAVILSSADDSAIPPEKVLRLQLVEGDDEPLIYFTACAYDERTNESHFDDLANVGVYLDDLIDAVNLLAEDRPIIRRVTTGTP